MAKERLIIEVDEKGARVVNRRIAGIGKTSAASASQVDLLKRALITLGGVAVLRTAVGTLASFSQEMSTVRAITQATESEFEALQARARELGAQTRFSASQAAEGLTNLARAGFDSAKAIDTVDDTLKLAQAGALDLGTAAQITAGLIRGFRVGTDQASRFVDVLALTANSAATDVLQLGEAMKFAAPVSASLGVEVEETSAVLGVLADNMLRGQMGGTGLRKVLSTLAKGAAPLEKALSRAQLTVDDVNVKVVGLIPALKNLAKANIETGEAFEIFGDRGQPAFEVINANIPVIEAFIAKNREAGGTVDRIATIMDDNLNGALLSVRSALEAVILSLGTAGGTMNVLVAIVRGLATGIRFLAENIEILQGFLIGVAVTQIPLLIKGITALGAAIAANPLGAFIIALSTVIGLLAAFKDDIKLTEDGLVSLGDFAKIMFEDIAFAVKVLVDEWKSILGIMDKDTKDASESAKSSFRSIIDTVAVVFDTMVGIVRGSIGSLQKFFGLIPFALKAMFVDVVNFVIDALNDMIRFTVQAINNIRAELEGFSRNIPGIAVNFDQIIAPQIGKVTEQTRVTFRDMGAEQARAWRQGFEETPAQDFVASVMERATEQVKISTEETEKSTAAIEQMAEAQEKNADKTDKATTAFDSFKAALLDGTETVKGLAAGLGEIFANSIDTAADALADFALSGFQNVKDLRKAFAALFADLAKQILKLIIKFAILQAVQAGLSALGGGGGAAGGAVSTVAGAASRQAGGPVFQGQPTFVGERGPELFVPPRTGTIVSNEALGRQQPPPAPTIINVTDPDEVSAAMSSAEGEEIILNVIAKNPNAVRNVLGQ